MIATSHAIVGAAIASAAPDPIIGLLLAFASHFVLDLVPHWDEGLGWEKKSKTRFWAEAILDVTVGFALAFAIFGRSVDTTYLVAAIIAAQLPDWAEAPYLFLGWKFPPFSWVYSVQHHMQWRMGLPWGAVSQAAVVTFAIVTTSPVKFF